MTFFFTPPNAPSNHTPFFKMNFSKAYGSILLPFVNEYKAAKNEKGRNAVVKNAVDAVTEGKNLLEDEGIDLPKDLKTVHFFFILQISTAKC